MPPECIELLSDADFNNLANHAEAADRDPEWPTESWQTVTRAGVMEWAIPSLHGGRELDAVSLLLGYERLAAACLTTTFILSQRDAAIRRICESGRDDLARELLRPLACGGRFATVGLSQLTTSRQHGGPALRVEETAAGLILDGVMPWVTGADHANHLITGGVLADGRQVLLRCLRTLRVSPSNRRWTFPPSQVRARRKSPAATRRSTGIGCLRGRRKPSTRAVGGVAPAGWKHPAWRWVSLARRSTVCTPRRKCVRT